MTFAEAYVHSLKEPSPEALWALQPYLLAARTPQAERALDVAGAYFRFLSAVRSKLTSKQYSTLAARLAATSLGVLAMHELAQGLQSDRRKALSDLVAGGIAESLEVASTLQHVKAWETEFASLHAEAAWELYGAFWSLSEEMQPDLSASQRHGLLQDLLAPALRLDIAGAVRAAIIIRLYQILLGVCLGPLLLAEAAQPEIAEDGR